MGVIGTTHEMEHYLRTVKGCNDATTLFYKLVEKKLAEMEVARSK